MSFRVFRVDDEEAGAVDVLERFFALERSFVHDPRMFGHRGPYCLAAAALLGAPAERSPADLAEAALAGAAQIAAHPAWLAVQGPALRLVLAACLVAGGREPATFVDERSGLHEAMEAAGVHYSPVHRTLLVLALRAGLDARGEPERAIGAAEIEATMAIYAALRRKHRLLCNERLLPIHAWLAVGLAPGAPGSGRRASLHAAPERLAQQTSALYTGLRKGLRLRRGRPLLAAASILARADLEVDALVERVREVHRALTAAGVGVGDNEYDELAVLGLLAMPVERSVAKLVELHDGLVAEFGWSRWAPAAVDLASALLLSDLRAHSDPLTGSLLQLELMLDTATMVSAEEAWIDWVF